MPDDHLFHPLDLDLALQEADESDTSGHAAIDLLVAALTDPRADGDERVPEYAATLIDSRRTGREREAIASMWTIVDRDPENAAWLTADIALLHARLGEREVAVDLLTRVDAEQRSRPPDERDLGFYAAAAITAIAAIGDQDLALPLLAEAQRLAELRDDVGTSALLHLLLARPASAPRTGSDRIVGAPAGQRARSDGATAGHPRLLYRTAYLPPAEHAAALERDLLDATVYRNHADYRRELQDSLEAVTAQPGASAVVVPLDVAGLLAFAAREGLEPARRSTRLAYNHSLQDAGRDIPWPPERNAACWCGSNRKYKKCCGAPEFTSGELPDPASMTLRIDLDHVRPPVWRRIAAPSNIDLTALHRLIQSAMGWYDEHLYSFEVGQTTLVDPRSQSADPSADGERLVSIASDVGDCFTYTYDFGDNWTHTVTVEEIREAGPENVPAVLEGAGACPPEDSGGVGRYMFLVAALGDPDHPKHDDAVERLGEGFDATRFELTPVPR